SGFKKYPVSIQEFVGEALRSIYQSEDVVIHAAGREDVDARMIGSGRPLIIEIKKPVKRSIGIEEANKALRELSRRYPIVVELFSRTTRSSKVFVKNEAKLRRKVYRVAVYSPEEILPQDLVKLEEFFSNREVKQRTPTRILRRKKDREKTKRVYAVRIVQVSRRVFESLIYCDGGLYVKELIHGDYGRTVPSFAEVVGKPLIPIELDVVLVED
ncbi:MAG: tRNA pseudouridine(54/55) synthase Pus10, partial [Desulfurococcaceae archaeon]|nr:tRNA pseudouridine(54/55) synthase Pus10 [Desulfurococcaceae archaeon]